MPPLLEHRLIVVTGKGGAGKTTIASALGLLAAARGVHTIVAEVGRQDRLPALFGLDGARPGVETSLRENLHSISIDPDLALLEWLQALGGRISGRLLATSSTFQYFAAAAPGAKELVSMVKVADLTRARRRRSSAAPYELVVLDAPATGHALGMLQSPATFGAIARVGPIAAQTRRVQELLQDPARTCYVAVAQPAELGVAETLELRDSLRRQLGRELHAVIVNGVLPRRFSAEELALLEGTRDRGGAERAAVRRAAAEAARAVHERGRFQQSQLARLRRAGLRIVTVPFRFSAEVDLGAIREIARLLERKLS
jgi:anion-transporting  ArsA/GET3 family ATPase